MGGTFDGAAGLLRKARRRLWMKYALRGVDAADNHERLDLAYAIEDPWNMESELERTRFQATNRCIEHAFGRVGSVLELGCGEGHQSECLAAISGEHYGVDVSPRAIDRARNRVPSASFAVGDVFSQPWGEQRHRFDLVVACEMLYCLGDPVPTIDRMRHLGRNGLVTFYQSACSRLSPPLERVPGLCKDWVSHGKTTWLVAWWRDG